MNPVAVDTVQPTLLRLRRVDVLPGLFSPPEVLGIQRLDGVPQGVEQMIAPWRK